MLIKLWECWKENSKGKVSLEYWKLKAIMKNPQKEKKGKDKKISKDQKKFREWEIISNFIYYQKE